MLKTIFLCFSICALNANMIELKDDQFEEFIQKADKPVIIDFWSEYCGPCQQMKPLVEELSEELKDQYIFVSLDISENHIAAKKYGIKSVPTFKIIEKNEVLGTFAGFTAKDVFLENIENAVQKKITQNTLLSAIQAQDFDQISNCLKSGNVNINAISKINLVDFDMQMTPLLSAVSTYTHSGSSLEIVKLLLKEGADSKIEIEFPEFDEDMALEGKLNMKGTTKGTVRSFLEETINQLSEEKIATFEDEISREYFSEVRKRAKEVLELL